MGISHEYHSAPRRARRGTVSGKLRFLGAVVAILLVSYAITAILEKGAEGADDTPSTNASGIAENILAPLPMQGEADMAYLGDFLFQCHPSEKVGGTFLGRECGVFIGLCLQG